MKVEAEQEGGCCVGGVICQPRNPVTGDPVLFVSGATEAAMVNQISSVAGAVVSDGANNG